MTEGRSQYSRREFLGLMGAATAGAILGSGEQSAEAKVQQEKKDLKKVDFSTNVLLVEIQKIAASLPEPEKERLLAAASSIFKKMDEVIHDKLFGSKEQEEKYFSTMKKNWEKFFPIIVNACLEETGGRNKELEGTLIAILCEETAMKIDVGDRGNSGPSGYYQIKKNTARAWGLRVNEREDERFDFNKSSFAVAHYLRGAYAKYGQWGLAMMAFGKGEAGLERIINDNFRLSHIDPKTLLSKGVNIVSIYKKSGSNRHTFIKEVLARHFNNLLESSQV